MWDLAAWVPLIVIGESLGVDPLDYPTLLQWSDDLLSGLDGGESSTERMTQAFVEYETYARRLIATRRTSPADDLLSTLVHAEVDGAKLSDDELIFDSLLIL
ncbi:MAG: cytochrome P450, partial [Acidimicrobiales bacterium]